MEQKPKTITLHPHQEKAWKSKKRFIALCAGVQGGKTTFGALWILNEAWEKGPGDYIIAAPSYRMLEQSTLVKFREIVPKDYGKFNTQRSTFVTSDGSRTFFLRSADKPESLEGITARAIWADEASLMKAYTWIIMQNRVSATRGRVLFTFTPARMNWVYHDLYRRWKDGDPDYEFIQFANVESPYFPREEYERAKRTLTETQFKLRYEGIFAKAEGLIYPDFGPQHIEDSVDIPLGAKCVGGIDFGWNNPFVALEGWLDGDDVLHVYSEYYQPQRTLAQHAQYLSKDVTYYADPSGKQEIEELISMGYDVRAADNDVNMGINRVNERIKTNRLKVLRERCRNLIDEKETYCWDEKDRPIKENDHCCDAERYMVMGLDHYAPAEIMVLG